MLAAHDDVEAVAERPFGLGQTEIERGDQSLPHAIVVTGRGRWFGAAVDRTMPMPGYALVDASVAASFGGDWLGVLRVDDLLDAAPETRNGFHLPGRVLSLVAQGTWN